MIESPTKSKEGSPVSTGSPTTPETSTYEKITSSSESEERKFLEVKNENKFNRHFRMFHC
jgi:uncharacterized membrane protein